MVYLQTLLIIQYPIVTHLATVSGQSGYKLFALLLVIIAIALRAMVTHQWRTVFVSGILMCGVYLVWSYGLINWITYTTPVLIPLMLLGIFGATLLPGKTPLVTAIGEAARGTLDVSMRQYTRRVTWIWTLTFIFLTTEAIILTLLDHELAWSWLINVVNPALLVTIFVGEFIYRKHRFPNHRHPKFMEYLNIVNNKR